MQRMLIVDDEEPLRTSLSWMFGKEGFLVTTAADGVSALDRVEQDQPDVVLLDVMLPGIDGMEVCRRIRARSDAVIVMLTAKDQVTDRVDGLERGADDYVTKPFNTRELLARVRAATRRRSQAREVLKEDRQLLAELQRMVGSAPHNDNRDRKQGTLRRGQLTVDLSTETAVFKGREATLTPEEARVLEALLRRGGQVVTRTDMLRALGHGEGDEAMLVLRLTIRHLCEKLGDDPQNPRIVVAVPGIGYQLGDVS